MLGKSFVALRGSVPLARRGRAPRARMFDFWNVSRPPEFDGVMVSEGDNRQKPRVPLRMNARLRDRHSNSYDVRVLDISVSGFRAEALYKIDADQIVWLTIPGMQGLEAEVTWNRGGVIGCRFKQPLHPAVLDHLAKAILG